MIKFNNTGKQYTLDEMMDAVRNPKNKLRSLEELDDVVEEIIDRNREWYTDFEKMIQEKLNDERTNS